MSRVFLTCVGRRDPYWEPSTNKDFQRLYPQYGSNYANASGVTKGPFLSFLEKIGYSRKPEDCFYLLSTSPGKEVRDPTHDNGEYLIEALIEIYRLSEDQIILQDLNNPKREPHWNPSIFDHVLPSLKAKVKDILNSKGYEREYIVVYSSGTPQMQSSWIALVSSGLLPGRLFRAEGDEVKIAPLFEDEEVKRAIRLLKDFAFKATSEVFEALSKSVVNPQKKALTRLLAKLFLGYYYWSIFHYFEANELLIEVQNLLKELESRWVGMVPGELKKLENLIVQQQRSLKLLLKKGPIRRKFSISSTVR